MIIIFTAGQLGNQIFQYSFVESIKNENEKVLTSKCEYFNLFEFKQNNYIFLNKYFRFIIRRILKFFGKMRIISTIKQNQEYMDKYEIDIDSYTYKKGLLPFLKIVDGFYQSKKFINFNPIIKNEYLKKANSYLSDIPKESQIIFVHIRRGDYLEWSVLGKKNPSLPINYYKSGIDWFLENYDNPFFIFLSNDSDYVEKEFNYIKNKKISKNSVGVDIAIMQNCENAILSNSTLSWWGFYLMENKNKIFAPKYWLGWQSKTWFPIGIELDFIEYIDIKDGI